MVKNDWNILYKIEKLVGVASGNITKPRNELQKAHNFQFIEKLRVKIKLIYFTKK